MDIKISNNLANNIIIKKSCYQCMSNTFVTQCLCNKSYCEDCIIFHQKTVCNNCKRQICSFNRTGNYCTICRK